MDSNPFFVVEEKRTVEENGTYLVFGGKWNRPIFFVCKSGTARAFPKVEKETE